MAQRCVDHGKTVHVSFSAAVRAAVHDSARYGRAYRPYRCPAGNGWHLTTKRHNAWRAA